VAHGEAIEFKHVSSIQASSKGWRSGTVGQAILDLLNTAAHKAEADSGQALETVQRLSSQLDAAQDRIAGLKAELRIYQEETQRAEGWLSRLSDEIENRLMKKPEGEQRFHRPRSKLPYKRIY
jgi:hypothetical protein